MGAKVSSKVLKLIECDLDADLLSDFDATLSLLKHCLVGDLFVQQMEEELVNVVLLVLVLSKLLRELPGYCHLLTLQEALK